MNDSGSDSFIRLAVWIAAAATLSWIAQTFQFLGDLDATEILGVIAGGAAQVSGALAMVCAAIIGRNMVTTASLERSLERDPRASDGSST